jgi:anionic cell wall polymer biosynthesis LytR-Cps2A-Psr (LCP) family protein
VLGGIPIHYYAEVDTYGAIKIIDAMGGVYMNVPIDMQYSDPDQNLYIDLKSGYQHLDGAQSLMFLRFRSAYPDADLGRISAQQEFLKAMLSQSYGLNIAAVAVTAQREVTSNMSITSAMALAARAAGMNGWEFVTHKLPGTTGMQNGLSYFFHDAAAAKELMRKIYAQ